MGDLGQGGRRDTEARRVRGRRLVGIATFALAATTAPGRAEMPATDPPPQRFLRDEAGRPVAR
jgi:hypothetical protein